ncbi:Coiled-coil domain-containing protein 58 [Lamellibrachia satsuma]|nr:Coiled-coil domain-containing protein 58 [Lamellibrachia satsuma]
MATSSASPREPTVSCDDFSFFQDILKQMRTLDDRIVNELNTKIPTVSFAKQINASSQCKELYEELTKGHESRCNVVSRCVNEVSTIVKDLKFQRETDRDNIPLLQKLRKEQTKLRLMQAELNVEEVVKERSLKVFMERCRLHYYPPPRS